jgi:hypothetical protein
MRDRQTIPRLAAAAVGGVALLLWAGPAAAQVPPAPPEACGALDTVGDTVGPVQDTVEGTAGQDLPADVADTVGTVGSTAGCPQAAADPGDESGSGSTSTTSTTAYESGSAALGSSGTLPRTGGPAAVAGVGSLAAGAAAIARLLLRRTA